MLVDLFKRRSLEDPETDLTATELASWLGATYTPSSGESVSITTAMRTSAVFACVRVIAESVASLPLIVYQRMGGRGKRRAPEHPLYELLHGIPNPHMTAVELRENLAGHVCLWGIAYCEKVYDGAGRIRELWPLRPDRMVLRQEDGKPSWWQYTMSSGEAIALSMDRVWRTRGIGIDRYTGYSVISQAREAIGTALATEKYGGLFFANAAHPGGVLQTDKKLNQAAATNLKASWEAAHKGMDYAHRIAVLEEGVQWQQVGMQHDDAQFLETRNFQVVEIARMFRMPLHMIGDLTRATFSNIEHQGIEFVTLTLAPWLTRFEQSARRDLLSESERKSYFVEHLVDGLLRGDIQSRYQAYATGRQNGWLSANDIRELENMNPVDGGDIYLVPLNMVPADDIGSIRSNGATPEGRVLLPEIRSDASGSAESRRRIAESYRRLVAQATERILKREEADIMRRAEKLLRAGDVAGFLTWLEEFYRDHPAFYEQYMLPVLESLAELITADAYGELGMEGTFNEALDAFVREFTATAAAKYCYSNHGQLREVVREAETGEELAALQARFDEWIEKTPDKQAMRQTVRCQNAVTREVWIGVGISKLRWVTHGENCPYCNALSGKVVGINSWFLDGDVDFEPEGADGPIRPSYNIGHAPAHDGCDCGIAPGG